MKNKYSKTIRKHNAFKELLEHERLENMSYEDDLSDLAEIRAKE